MNGASRRPWANASSASASGDPGSSPPSRSRRPGSPSTIRRIFSTSDARIGIRVGDLADASGLEQSVRDNVSARNRLVHDTMMEWESVLAQVVDIGRRLTPMVRDVSLMLSEAFAAGKSVLFEGAQGTLLDIDHGTYPYVTSSNASIGGVCTGLGVGPRAIGGVMGVVKAYTTRVGEGPLPTELNDEMGKRLRDGGNEYGAVTGRPRRCGWYDAVAARYGVRINGLDVLALTKLDVLDGLDEISICTAYRCGDRTLADFPSDVGQLASCVPVYETMPGWTQTTKGVRRFEDLPENARRYVRRLEEVSGVPAAIVSTGSERNDTILRDDVFVQRLPGFKLAI